MATGPQENDGQPEQSGGQPEESGQSQESGLEQELDEILAQAEVDLDTLPVEDQVRLLKARLEQAQKETAENLDLAQRAQAEMVNFRRRTDEDRIANSKYANSRLISKVLPVLEELELAIGHIENQENQENQTEGQTGISESVLEGFKLIQRKLTGVLESEGVSAIQCIGLMFNPLEHEALGTEESTEVEPGYITKILRPGFRLHDRVISPAQVMVARAPQNS